MTTCANILTMKTNLGSFSIIITYFCFKLIESRGLLKADVLEVDKVLQKYLRRSYLFVGESFSTILFPFFVC